MARFLALIEDQTAAGGFIPLRSSCTVKSVGAIRRQKGAGTVVFIRDRWFPRRRKNGADEFGDPHLTRDAAELQRIELWGQNAQARPSKSTIPVLNDWAIRCMEGAYGRNLADATFENAELVRVKHLAKTNLGAMRVDRITTLDCQEWIDNLRAQKRQRESGGLTTIQVKPSPVTVRRYAAVVSKWLDLARKAGFIRTNPMRDVDYPKAKRKPKRILSQDEFSKFDLTVTIDLVLLLTLTTSIHRKEVCDLEWKHVDLSASNNAPFGKLKIPGTKTDSRERTVPLTKGIAKELAKLKKPEGKVFLNAKGDPMTPNRLDKTIRKRLTQLGFGLDVRLHALRRTFASLAIDEGAPLKSVMKMMGHSRAQTTIETYAQSIDEGDAKTIDLVAKRLKRKA